MEKVRRVTLSFRENQNTFFQGTALMYIYIGAYEFEHTQHMRIGFGKKNRLGTQGRNWVERN